ncbi:MAG: VWA domain-containing protein [Vicinamibacterales bacterium]
MILRRFVPIAVACGTVVLAPRAPLVVPLGAQQPMQFRASTSAVAVDVSVQDGRRAVLGLTADDFELLDDGVPQRIAAAALEHVPLDVTLVVDTSGSLAGPAIAQFKRDIETITGLLGADDRLRMVTFATRAAEAFGWRPGSDAPDVVQLPAGGATALYQALAAVLLRRPDPGRRQLIVAMSDGVDNVSLLDAPDVLAIAKRADALMHIVLRNRATSSVSGSGVPFDMGQILPQIPDRSSPPTSSFSPPIASHRTWGWVPYQGEGQTSVLRDAAEVTGGRLRTVAPATSLADAFKTALDEFRTSYVLWFTPEGVAPTGWHTLEVKVRQGRHDVRARTGYQAGGAK